MPAKRAKKPRGRRPIDWTKVEGTLAYWQVKWEQRQRSLSPLNSYGMDTVEQFVEFMGRRRSVKTIGPTEIRSYQRLLARQGKSELSIYGRLSRLSCFLGYVTLMRGMDFNPVKVPPRPPTRPRKTPPLPTTWREARQRMQRQRVELATRLRLLTANIEHARRKEAEGAPFPGAEPVTTNDRPAATAR